VDSGIRKTGCLEQTEKAERLMMEQLKRSTGNKKGKGKNKDMNKEKKQNKKNKEKEKERSIEMKGKVS